ELHIQLEAFFGLIGEFAELVNFGLAERIVLAALLREGEHREQQQQRDDHSNALRGHGEGFSGRSFLPNRRSSRRERSSSNCLTAASSGARSWKSTLWASSSERRCSLRSSISVSLRRLPLAMAASAAR